MGYVPKPDCLAMFPHEPHSWREGFLWLKKKTCKGITQESIETLYKEIYPPGWEKKANPAIGERVKYAPGEKHRHRFFLSRLWTTDEELVFICDAHAVGCKVKHRFEREDFWSVESEYVRILKRRYLDGQISANQLRAGMGLSHSMTADKPHKHSYHLDIGLSDPWTMLFKCNTCGAERPTSRYDYYEMILK